MPKGEVFIEQARAWFQRAKEDLAWSRYALEGGCFSYWREARISTKDSVR